MNTSWLFTNQFCFEGDRFPDFSSPNCDCFVPQYFVGFWTAPLIWASLITGEKCDVGDVQAIKQARKPRSCICSCIYICTVWSDRNCWGHVGSVSTVVAFVFVFVFLQYDARKTQVCLCDVGPATTAFAFSSSPFFSQYFSAYSSSLCTGNTYVWSILKWWTKKNGVRGAFKS